MTAPTSSRRAATRSSRVATGAAEQPRRAREDREHADADCERADGPEAVREQPVPEVRADAPLVLEWCATSTSAAISGRARARSRPDALARRPAADQSRRPGRSEAATVSASSAAARIRTCELPTHLGREQRRAATASAMPPKPRPKQRAGDQLERRASTRSTRATRASARRCSASDGIAADAIADKRSPARRGTNSRASAVRREQRRGHHDRVQVLRGGVARRRSAPAHQAGARKYE